MNTCLLSIYLSGHVHMGGRMPMHGCMFVFVCTCLLCVINILYWMCLCACTPIKQCLQCDIQNKTSMMLNASVTTSITDWRELSAIDVPHCATGYLWRQISNQLIGNSYPFPWRCLSSVAICLVSLNRLPTSVRFGYTNLVSVLAAIVLELPLPVS